MDQKTDIQVAYRGYGAPTYGPIPASFPGFENQKEIYPFDINKAKQYLTTNGWTVPASGVATCTQAGTGSGQCGAGVKAGATAEFTLETFTSTQAQDEIIQEFKSDAARAGIQISVRTVDPPTMVADAAKCRSGDANCNWQIINWGATGYNGGYPVSASLFSTGGALNRGSFQDPNIDGLISDAVHSSSGDALRNYSDYVARNLPDIFWPVQVAQIYAVVSNLRGVTVNGPGNTSTPEEWYFVK
jgi:peptide/nickel transport system substrate-binding protein